MATTEPTPVPAPHCESCNCFNSGSLDHFNRRCQRLIAVIRAELLDGLPPAVRACINEGSSRYSLGFTGFKLGSKQSRTAGQFLVALYPEPCTGANRRMSGVKFFGVCTRRDPTETIPVVDQTSAGAEYDISMSPTLDDLEQMVEWSDADLSDYLRVHLLPLRDAVVDAVAKR